MYVVQYDALQSDIVEKLKYANLYYSKEYSTVGRETWYFYNECYIQIVIISSIRKQFRSATLVCEPFCIADKNPDEGDLKDFLNELLDTMKKKLNVDWVNVTAAGSLFQAYPNNSKRIRWGNYVLDLAGKTAEDLLQSYDSKHRNMVRRGEKANLEIRFGGADLLQDYLYLDKQTWKRSNRDTDNSALYQMYLDKLGEKAIIAIAYDEDHIPQCGILGFYNQAMFYYMFGASADKPVPGSTHYLQYCMMKYMIQKEVKAYNFVGCRINVDKDSKYAHIQHFKKGFGGKLEHCYLFKAELNKGKSKLFKLLSRVLRKGYASDVIDDEIHKWQEIN